MTFLDSAEDVRLDENRYLRARLRNVNGDMVDAELNLNDIIGNESGRFVWGGAGYADSSERGWLSIEGDNQPILRAALFDGDGNLVENVDINLAERIGNNDGQFYFQ